MSLRLGSALAEHLRRTLPQSARNFVLVEGVPTTVAEGMGKAWDDLLPRLAIVSASPALFGEHAIGDVSGTQLRNRRGGRGVVLVLCDGEQVPDRQSLNLFDSVSPSILLESAEGMGILSQQAPTVDLDGPSRAVREAINQADPATRPSAASVAAYLDRLAAGDDPLGALPVIGAFADHAGPGERVESSRIADNLSLAARRTSDDFLRPTAYADLRKRAEAVLRRRPSIGSAGAPAAADEVMEQIQEGSPALLRTLRFDEAREIMERRPQDLPETVRLEMEQFRAGLTVGSQAEGLPWHRYEQRAGDLRHRSRQRDAALELLDLDDAQRKQVFTRPTRTKLERLVRDKSVSGSNPSCPEAAIVQAAQQLGGLIERVQVLSPLPPTQAQAANRTGAGRILTLACARLRLGGLMHAWDKTGGEVDGLLLRAVDDEDLGDLLAAFSDARLSTGAKLPPLQLRLHADDGSTVQVDWRPDLDDLAALRAALLFSEAPALTLALRSEPTLHAFCDADNAVARPVPGSLLPLAERLKKLARRSLDSGLDPGALDDWAAHWTTACEECEAAGDAATAEALALAGAVVGEDNSAALTCFAPMKSEWLSQYLQALRTLVRGAEEPKSDPEPTDAVATANAIAHTTAAHHPSHLRVTTRDQVLLPTSEGRFWSLYGGASTRDESGFAGDAFSAVVMQLLKLQPEAAGHLRCIAWGPGAADLLVGEAIRLIGRRAGSTVIQRIEIFCIGTTDVDKPRPETLAAADDQLRDSRDVLELRYLDNLDEAHTVLHPGSNAPAVHVALVTGLTEGGKRLQIESPEVSPPADHPDVLFTPRVWQRPKQDRRTLLMPPSASPCGQTWLRVQNAVQNDAWPERGQPLQVPEVRTGALDVAGKLRRVHELALWVATLDRYATRDSLEQALGPEDIAILHQERRLGGDSPLSLVISQKSGGPADRAIGRSLRAAGIVAEKDVALSIGTQLRKVASQGYGILALQAATSGAGINELVGHVVAFSLLATATTPWPLPPGCRVLLVSLDEYRHWFPGKRADLLAIALDTGAEGVHVAAIEVKARRSDENDAASEALDQLNKTLAVTRWAAYPETDTVHTRLWLNRIAEAAYAVARESRFKLDAQELRALEAFRLGHGSLEWAGVGFIFGPKVEPLYRTYRKDLANDIVPVVLRSIPLTEELLQKATGTSLTKLRTVQADAPPLQGTRTRRRPEGKAANRDETATDTTPQDGDRPPAPQPPEERAPVPTHDETLPEPTVKIVDPTTSDEPGPTPEPPQQPPAPADFHAPLIGWDADTGEEVRWHPAGAGQKLLQNGHTEIWGSSGMGKTQFAMILLAQLSRQSGSRFGIADFKNDYSDDTGFPAFAEAQFIDLWNGGAPYNPLALDVVDGDEARAVQSAVIELRDAIEEAVRSVSAKLGIKQRNKLQQALQNAYSTARSEGRWPTLRTLDDHLDEDLEAIIGDLTRNELFRSGEPMGNAIDRNIVFGLSRIPGSGQTTVLAAGFILSALLAKIESLPPVPNTIRYLMVVDEAHRVAPFKAIQKMIREGRSKGLAVILATQGPLDLSNEVAANAQTKICFGLPDATVATMAARRLEHDNPRLPEQIRTLGKSEAFVSFAGAAPRLLRMAQAYRDAEALGLPPL